MIPVTVRLSNINVDKHITRRVEDLSFRSVVPGGFASASFGLQSLIDINDPLLAPFTRVYVYDRRTGQVVWEGRLEMPGKSAGDQGEVWALTAVGPSAHATNTTVPLIYVDTDLSNGWVRVDNVTPGADISVTEDPGNAGNTAQVFRFPNGQLLATNSRVAWQYRRIVEAGMKLARFRYDFDCGRTLASLGVQSVTRNGGTETPISTGWNVAGGSATAAVVTNFANGRNTVENRIIWTGGATTVGDDLTWASFRNWIVEALRLTKAGVEITTGYTGAVLAHWVVEDLLGRLLTEYDGANAALTAATHVIDQLAYPDGVTPAQVLDDLIALEPTFFWAAWESNTAGKNRFEWKTWPTDVRYEASVVDGFDSPAPSFEQFDKVRVRWKDTAGMIRVTTRTQTVQDLLDAGVSHSGFIDLGDEVGTLANAQKAGDSFLAEHRYPPSRGTLTVARPVLDLVDSRRVDPWQLRPGELVRVRGIEGSINSLNASDRDGQTVFKIVSVTVGSDGGATLELDSFAPTEERILADLATARPRRR